MSELNLKTLVQGIVATETALTTLVDGLKGEGAIGPEGPEGPAGPARPVQRSPSPSAPG